MMFEQQKQELIDTLIQNGINNRDVLDAIYFLDRHKFVPDVMISHAYKDVALPIGYDQTISQPYTVAFMTNLLDLKKNDKVLEIGTGSGYQAAVLNKLGLKVFTIERNNDIYNRTLKLFDELALRIVARCSDGTIGWEEFAPFDGIIVTAGSPEIPPRLIKQLKVGGNMVIPVGDRNTQVMKLITKIDDDNVKISEYKNFKFVPLIGREGWKEK